MTIDAKDKIINAIEKTLANKTLLEKEYYDYDEAINFMKTYPHFYKIDQLLEQYGKQYLQFKVEYCAYSNDLIKLKSYIILNGEYIIYQTIITDDLKKDSALVHIYEKYETKSLQQYFIKSKEPNLIFGYPEDREIEESKTEVEIDGQTTGIFTRIKKAGSSDIVYTEKYLPVNMLSESILMPQDSSLSNELEIAYSQDIQGYPIYAKFNKNNEVLEKKGYTFTANSSNYAYEVVDMVIEEADKIIETIKSKINNYQKITTNPQKKLGTYPNQPPKKS